MQLDAFGNHEQCNFVWRRDLSFRPGFPVASRYAREGAARLDRRGGNRPALHGREDPTRILPRAREPGFRLWCGRIAARVVAMVLLRGADCISRRRIYSCHGAERRRSRFHAAERTGGTQPVALSGTEYQEDAGKRASENGIQPKVRLARKERTRGLRSIFSISNAWKEWLLRGAPIHASDFNFGPFTCFVVLSVFFGFEVDVAEGRPASRASWSFSG